MNYFSTKKFRKSHYRVAISFVDSAKGVHEETVKPHSQPKFYAGPIFVFSKHRKYLDFHQIVTIDRIYLIVYTHRSQLIYAWCDNIMWHGLSSSWQSDIHLRSSMLDQYSYFRNIANDWTSIRLSLLIEYIWLYTHIEVNWFMHDAIISCDMDYHRRGKIIFTSEVLCWTNIRIFETSQIFGLPSDYHHFYNTYGFIYA
jgi:hypothetical protein